MAAITLFSAAALACADPGLPRHEPPTPTPTPEPGQNELNWASRVCAFIPGFERAADACDVALEATSAPDLEVLRDEMLFIASFDLKQSASSASQWIGLLSGATTSSTRFGDPAYTAAGVAVYERTLFDLFLDFEPVLNYAVPEIRQAQSLEDLEAIHASVSGAREQLTASARDAARGLSPEALLALRSVDECAFIRG